MGKESQLLEAAAAGNNSKVEVSDMIYIFIACMQYALILVSLASSQSGYIDMGQGLRMDA